MLFATSNPNKLAEVSAIMGYPLEQIDLGELDEIQAIDGEEVIRHKAKLAYEKAWKPVLVEDVSLSFRARNGLPWALIKWFLEAQKDEGIIKMMSTFDDRHVVARCYVSYYNGKDRVTVKWEVEGSVPRERGWVSQFGWDALFLPNGYQKTYAQMSKEEKNTISHRGLARKKMKEILDAHSNL